MCKDRGRFCDVTGEFAAQYGDTIGYLDEDCDIRFSHLDNGLQLPGTCPSTAQDDEEYWLRNAVEGFMVLPEDATLHLADGLKHVLGS